VGGTGHLLPGTLIDTQIATQNVRDSARPSAGIHQISSPV
jgi:hypothetical protein